VKFRNLKIYLTGLGPPVSSPRWFLTVRAGF
jgi:hypothetical protein